MQQWLDAVEKDPSMQKAPWLLLLETDYVWVKPLQVGGWGCYASSTACGGGATTEQGQVLHGRLKAA
jgi:hypothetical protein